MRPLDPDIGAHVNKAMRATGIEVRTGERLEAVEPGTVHTTALGVRTFLDGTPLWLATGRRQPWAELWPALRTL